MREDHFKKVNSIMSDSISFNQCQYNDNAEIIQNNLLNYYGLETSIDEIIKVENVFSKQSNDTKKVFEKIIEVMHRNNEYISRRESGMINMMSVVSELSKGYGRNEDRIVSAIVLLERQGYIEEQEYNEFNYNSYRESSDGTFIDLSRDYYYRIQNGRWFMTMSGMILDACYTQQGYL